METLVSLAFPPSAYVVGDGHESGAGGVGKGRVPVVAGRRGETLFVG